MQTLFFFNTNIVPDEAVVRVKKITANEAREIEIGWQGEKVSAIGHEATAAAFTEIMPTKIPVNRIQADPKGGDKAISLKLKGRLPEGQVLNRQQLEEMGFELFLMEFYSTESRIVTDGIVGSGDYVLAHYSAVDLFGQKSLHEMTV